MPSHVHLKLGQNLKVPNVACAPVKFDLDCEAAFFLSKRLTDLRVMSNDYSYCDIQ